MTSLGRSIKLYKLSLGKKRAAEKTLSQEKKDDLQLAKAISFKVFFVRPHLRLRLNFAFPSVGNPHILVFVITQSLKSFHSRVRGAPLWQLQTGIRRTVVLPPNICLAELEAIFCP